MANKNTAECLQSINHRCKHFCPSYIDVRFIIENLFLSDLAYNIQSFPIFNFNYKTIELSVLERFHRVFTNKFKNHKLTFYNVAAITAIEFFIYTNVY